MISVVWSLGSCITLLATFAVAPVPHTGFSRPQAYPDVVVNQQKFAVQYPGSKALDEQAAKKRKKKHDRGRRRRSLGSRSSRPLGVR